MSNGGVLLYIFLFPNILSVSFSNHKPHSSYQILLCPSYIIVKKFISIPKSFQAQIYLKVLLLEIKKGRGFLSAPAASPVLLFFCPPPTILLQSKNNYTNYMNLKASLCNLIYHYFLHTLYIYHNLS